MFIIGRETLDLQTSRRMSLLDARKCTLHARSKPMHYEVNSGFHFELKKTWRKCINLGFKNAISVRIKMLPCSADAACFSSVKGVVGNVFYKKKYQLFSYFNMFKQKLFTFNTVVYGHSTHTPSSWLKSSLWRSTRPAIWRVPSWRYKQTFPETTCVCGWSSTVARSRQQHHGPQYCYYAAMQALDHSKGVLCQTERWTVRKTLSSCTGLPMLRK